MMAWMGLLLWALTAPIAFPQEDAPDRAAPDLKGVYVVTYRAPGHVIKSTPDVFHSAAADVRKALTAGGVVLVEDKERGFIENESKMSLESMTKLAREAGAEFLLFVTVDRPTTKWIKLTLQSYDLNAKLLWEEPVDSGMSGMSGASGYKKCFENLDKKLPKRIGGPGLPVSAP